MTDPEGNRETYAYDAGDRLCRKTDRNGTETTYTYNLYNNLLERKAKRTSDTTASLSERYEYTAEGLLKSAISNSISEGIPAGMQYTYTYDSMDRLMEKKASGRTLLSFTYDLNGNLTSQKDVTGKTMEYRYDLIDRVSEVWDNGNKVAEYGYNPDGTIKSLRCGSLYTEYAYDTDLNLTGLKTMLGNEILADNHYRYDGNGNCTEKDQIQGTTTYAYDAMDRLKRVEYPGRKEELFYDKAGNRTKRICNGMEELYRYDKRNRLTTYTKGGVNTEFDYDNAGNLLKDDKARYEYDAFNRNTKVETFSGDIQINRYDGEGLRHEVEENGKLFTFIYRGTEIVAEESREDKIRYIRTGELLASDAESARTYYHYASDEMGSITHVVTGEDKENELPDRRYPAEGQILNRYEYDAWGNLTTCEEKIRNRFKYNGQQYDQISGQYYLRARYYNPVIGRFTQEDTYRGDGLNLYAYCKNNPVYYVDPSGHKVCPKGVKRISAEIRKRRASRDDVKKLSGHLREKLHNKEKLTRAERNAAKLLGIDIPELSRKNEQKKIGEIIREKMHREKFIMVFQRSLEIGLLQEE